MKTKLFIFLFLTAIIFPNVLFAQFVQQGPKLTGTGLIGSNVQQGNSVAISSDGNTAIMGGPGDNNNVGAVWIFTRSGGVWTQQGSKLVGTGTVGSLIFQGWSVAISSDGNTAIAGGYEDNGGVGAVWVFTRSGNVWTQQGTKLVGTAALGSATQGISVAISSDGNTFVEGGEGDNGGAGAVWVFVRSGGVWTQQAKIVGTGSAGNAFQGTSVGISSDGNTAVAGGSGDNNNGGAVWIFIRSGTAWTQQGSKLVGTGAVGNAWQGWSSAISSDGNNVIIGGYLDNGGLGASWVFTRSGGVWTQQGPKLVGTGAVGNLVYQGYSVSISSNGNTAIIGADNDSNDAGAIWIFTRNGNVWTQLGTKLAGTGGNGQSDQGNSVAISSDGSTAIEGGPGDNSTPGAIWVFVNSGLGITPISNEVPKNFSLLQNYPNPFNPATKIKFDIPSVGNAYMRSTQLKIYDVLGREVATLVNQNLQPGTYEVSWDASNYQSGVYFYKLVVGDNTNNGGFAETKKMMIVK